MRNLTGCRVLPLPVIFFTFAMLMLRNIVTILIWFQILGLEGVGVRSYLLIGLLL